MDWAGEDLREKILVRSGGVCECCGTRRYESLHHRTPRGMGGSTDPDLNSPANIVAVCGHGTAGCHGRIEVSRIIATTYGWLVPHWASVDESPILYRGIWSLLDVDGWVVGMDSRERLAMPDPRAWRANLKSRGRRY